MKLFKYCLIILLFLLLAANLYAQEKSTLCEGSNVIISYAEIDDYHIACQAVKDIISLAQKIQLQEDLSISLTFVDRLVINQTGKSLAIFNPNSMEIQVLSIDNCKKIFGNGAVLGQSIDLELYRSIIIHELAHALFWLNKGNNNIAREIHEYFAYTIQLASLSESIREQIILSSNVSAFSNREEITEEYYLLNPTRFAVKSYLHFINAEHDWPYLKRLLEE